MTYETQEYRRHHGRARLAWPFIIGLGSLALLEPVTHALGLFGEMHPGARHFAILAGVSVIWLALVAYVRPPRPFLTVILAGACYVTVVATAGLIVGPLIGIGGGSPGLWVFPIAVVSMASTHMIWFVVVAAIAHVVTREAPQ
ncbi:hypothetical protein [Hoyosella altamirensis]|uniref:Uncharacterized protein n=1 Tax=Hoyosella altamirensis TaxID=616997 RepID=A0A839RIN4_9ACTN|nr:hypothetical protein [Hoyosella altamirensis]MBB3036006.1 hypothetical protein [Hoyosella altamirensis]